MRRGSCRTTTRVLPRSPLTTSDAGCWSSGGARLPPSAHVAAVAVVAAVNDQSTQTSCRCRHLWSVGPDTCGFIDPRHRQLEQTVRSGAKMSDGYSDADSARELSPLTLTTEGCQSGRMGQSRKLLRSSGPPWVRIPRLPPVRSRASMEIHAKPAEQVQRDLRSMGARRRFRCVTLTASLTVALKEPCRRPRSNEATRQRGNEATRQRLPQMRPEI